MDQKTIEKTLQKKLAELLAETLTASVVLAGRAAAIPTPVPQGTDDGGQILGDRAVLVAVADDHRREQVAGQAAGWLDDEPVRQLDSVPRSELD